MTHGCKKQSCTTPLNLSHLGKTGLEARDEGCWTLVFSVKSNTIRSKCSPVVSIHSFGPIIEPEMCDEGPFLEVT